MNDVPTKTASAGRGRLLAALVAVGVLAAIVAGVRFGPTAARAWRFRRAMDAGDLDAASRAYLELARQRDEDDPAALRELATALVIRHIEQVDHLHRGVFRLRDPAVRAALSARVRGGVGRPGDLEIIVALTARGDAVARGHAIAMLDDAHLQSPELARALADAGDPAALPWARATLDRHLAATPRWDMGIPPWLGEVADEEIPLGWNEGVWSTVPLAIIGDRGDAGDLDRLLEVEADVRGEGELLGLIRPVAIGALVELAVRLPETRDRVTERLREVRAPHDPSPRVVAAAGLMRLGEADAETELLEMLSWADQAEWPIAPAWAEPIVRELERAGHPEGAARRAAWTELAVRRPDEVAPWAWGLDDADRPRSGRFAPIIEGHLAPAAGRVLEGLPSDLDSLPWIGAVGLGGDAADLRSLWPFLEAPSIEEPVIFSHVGGTLGDPRSCAAAAALEILERAEAR